MVGILVKYGAIWVKYGKDMDRIWVEYGRDMVRILVGGVWVNYCWNMGWICRRL